MNRGIIGKFLGGLGPGGMRIIKGALMSFLTGCKDKIKAVKGGTDLNDPSPPAVHHVSTEIMVYDSVPPQHWAAIIGGTENSQPI